MCEGDVQNLFQGKGGVDGRGDRKQEGGSVSRSALILERELKLTSRPAQTHQRHGQQDERDNEQN
jgi:hypothetical protein